MEQLKIQLDTIINGQTEILKELRDVKQNVVDLTEKVDQLLVRIDALEKPPLQNTPNQCCISPRSSQTSILDLPPEILEMVFQNFTSTQDVENCSIALVGTRHEEFVTQKFLKPQLNYLKSQLKIFASLDLNLKESLRNEGWSEECEDIKLIIDLWKEFKPSLPGKIILNLTF